MSLPLVHRPSTSIANPWMGSDMSYCMYVGAFLYQVASSRQHQVVMVLRQTHMYSAGDQLQNKRHRQLEFPAGGEIRRAPARQLLVDAGCRSALQSQHTGINRLNFGASLLGRALRTAASIYCMIPGNSAYPTHHANGYPCCSAGVDIFLRPILQAADLQQRPW